MACSSQSMLSANSYSFLHNQRILRKPKWFNGRSKFFSLNATSSSSEEECNVEECAPEKEPAVYVADSAISSGAAGTSSAGADNTAGLTAFLALIAIAAASSILLQVGKNAPEVQTVQYSGPPLSYYISKFKPATVVEAVTVVAEPQTAPPVEEVQVSGEGSEASLTDEVVPEVKDGS